MDISDQPFAANPPDENKIAIVGIGCLYPGARTPKELWENILAKRQQFRRMPDGRLPLADYYAEDRRAPDKTYGREAALLDGYAFDWAARKIPRSTADATDIAHWVALDTALAMLEDAGYTAARLPKETTQVIVGNTLTGEFMRANTMRLRWPYVLKCLRAAAHGSGWSSEALTTLERNLEKVYKSPFPETNEDSLAGGLANTIAGRIANYLDLNGGCYTVDGACSSSLLAVHMAATSLTAGHCDFVIAGGVDISLDPFELVGFAKAGALSNTKMSVYDARSNGFIPGEGCGFVGLKRLADARRDGDRIYAVLDGWGISSDGRGGITAPSTAGQHLSHMRAYRQASVSPADVDFVEGHGTGTVLGDTTELAALAMTLSQQGDARPRGVTSLKSIIGHTKAAAGIGALIKGAIAVNQRVLPPTAGCEQPRATTHSVYPMLRGTVRAPGERLRAGVSAMGFGGINVHVTLTSPDTAPDPALRGDLDARAVIASWQNSEVFPLSASSLPQLRDAVERLAADADGISIAELADLAAHLARQADERGPWRAALVAQTPAQLREQLERLQRELANDVHDVMLADEGIALGHASTPPRIGFLFPGQGSQQPGMARALTERYTWARDFAARTDRWAAAKGTHELVGTMHAGLDALVDREALGERAAALQQTEVAQPAIVFASALWLRALDRLGIRPACVAGHSLGELTAFHAAGALDEQALIELAVERGRRMAARSGDAGAMVSLACDRKQAEALVAAAAHAGYAVLANVNSDRQVVVSGDVAAIDAVERAASNAGVDSFRLRVSNAFHSRLVQPAADYLREHAPVPERCGALTCTLLSSTDGSAVRPGIALRQHFADQLIRPVDFVATLDAMAKHVDVLVEVGTGRVLSNLAAQVAATRELRCLPVEGKAESWHDFNWLLASLHVLGAPVDWRNVHADRYVRPFVPASRRTFITNPCERPLALPEPSETLDPLLTTPSPEAGIDVALDRVFDYLKRRSGFLTDVIRSDMRSEQEHAHTGPQSLRSAAREPRGKPPSERSLNSLAETPPENTRSTDGPIRDRNSAAVPAESASAQSAWAVLKRLVVEITGFDDADIDPSVRLNDDLNLDSIKSASLIARACDALGIAAGVLNASSLTDLPLGRIAETMQAQLRGAPAQTDEPQVLDVLFDEVSRVTGFARDELTADMRMVDDLNLDSIKAAAILAEAIARLRLNGALAPATLSAATLGEIASQMRALTAAKRSSNTAVAEPSATPAVTDGSTLPEWVRAFEMDVVPAPPLPPASAMPGVRCCVQSFGPHDDTAAAIVGALRAQGAHADDGNAGNDRVDHYIAVLPKNRSADGAATRERLASLVEPLRHAATTALQRGCRSITFVQFGWATLFGADPQATVDASCSQAFAASLRLEHPELKVRVIDFPFDAANDLVSERVVREISDEAGYRLSVYDAAGERSELTPRAIDTALLPARAVGWSNADVVLVTGGAKGITAELALAFARQSRARIALVGRSAPDASDVTATLARYARENLTACYFQCDVSRPENVAATVADINRRLGPVTAWLHGAGINRPRRFEQASVDDIVDEAAPKLLGALALCDALRDQPLKIAIALGSIIGIAGMAGNAWYAWANQAMDIVFAQLRRRRPQVSTLTLAYSVWSEIGMGARMGSDKHLAQLGVGAIPPQIGVDYFLDLLCGLPARQQIVVAGSAGGLETWRSMSGTPEARGRFAGDVVRYQPGVELVTRTRLSLTDDPYLHDHNYHGVYLFPTVFGLEAMAQAAQTVAGTDVRHAFRFERIMLERPVIVNADGGTSIEIRACVQPRKTATEPSTVHVEIFTDATDYRHEHFSCVVVMEASDAALCCPPPASPVAPLADLSPADLYGRALFHGPRFQRISAIYALGSSAALIGLNGNGDSAAFAAGDPYLRDGLLQTGRLICRGDFLPVGIERIDRYAPEPGADSTVFAKTEVTSSTDDELVCNVVTFTDGRVVERLTGYRLKRVSHDRLAPTAEDWVDPGPRDACLLDRALAEACGALSCNAPRTMLRYTPRLAGMERARRRIAELPMLTSVAEAAINAGAAPPDVAGTIDIHWDESGKPLLSGEPGQFVGVSLAHDRSHCLCVSGPGTQGCDIETIESRDQTTWQNLLGNRHAQWIAQLIDLRDTLDEAGTRIWCVLEAACKALGTAHIDLRYVRHAARAIEFAARAEAESTDVTVLTLPLHTTRHGTKMCAFVVEPKQTAETGHRSAPALRRAATGPAIADAEKRKPATTVRHIVSFREIRPPAQTLGGSAVAYWMGHLREAGGIDIADEMIADFTSGAYGMVTNHSNVAMISRVKCLDRIDGHLWFTRLHGPSDSSIDIEYEWHNVLADGRTVPVARASMTMSWVKKLTHGRIEPAPLPAYWRAFLATRIDDRRSAPLDATEPAAAQTATFSIESPPIYVARPGRGPRPVLHRQTFETSNCASNLVGNVYFAEYYGWQDAVLDAYMHRLRKLTSGRSADGEGLHCLHEDVRHLREAMPFDTVETVMTLNALHRDGLQLGFEHYRLEPDRTRVKLAVGSASYGWVSRAGRAERIETRPLPAELLRALEELCDAAEVTAHR